jgi:hypothetical protein
MSVISHIPSSVHHAISISHVVSPRLLFSHVHGPCSSFHVLMSLVPPLFPLFSPCCLSCPCMWCALFLFLSWSWSWSWFWSLHLPPSTLQAVAHSRGGGCWVVVLAVVFVPAVPTMPAFPMPLAPSSHHSCLWCFLFPPHE